MDFRLSILNKEHEFSSKGNLIFSSNKKGERFVYLSTKAARKELKKFISEDRVGDVTMVLKNSIILKHERTVRKLKI